MTAYDSAADRWETVTSMPQGRQAFGAARVGNRAYLMAGALTCGGGGSPDNLTLSLH
ncbi:hypothetical protein Asp14428_66720 [Actinoplanes sp. NBRC 14428]|nr:hypothetical protein Asp14428_66720 [Actinoplanes sp. NBRC 14428]